MGVACGMVRLPLKGSSNVSPLSCQREFLDQKLQTVPFAMNQVAYLNHHRIPYDTLPESSSNQRDLMKFLHLGRKPLPDAGGEPKRTWSPTKWIAEHPLYITIQSTGWHHWTQTFQWAAFNLFGSLMPMWCAYILLRLHAQPVHFGDFISHGEFALYTAAFLSPSLYQVLRNIKESKYVLGTGSVMVAVVGLGIVATLYAGVGANVSPTPDTARLPVDGVHFLIVWSVVLFIFSLLFGCFVTLVENQFTEPNVERIRSLGEQKLEKAVVAQKPEVSDQVKDLAFNEPVPAPIQDTALARAFKEPIGEEQARG